MRTVFITSFHPLISRNIISGGIIPALTRGGSTRVVVVVPDYKRSFYEETYRYPNVTYEGVDVGPAIRSRRVSVSKRIAEALPNTKRAAIGRRRTLSGTLKPAWIFWLFYAPIGLIGKSRLAVRLFRFIDFHLTPAGRFYPLLDRYRPDLVFSTDIQNEHDVALMQDARRRGHRILGMVRSWDNLTMRALRFVPQHLLVHNEIIKAEAVRYHGVPVERITVVGIPHYDRYAAGPTVGRADFLRSLGLDPARRTILYAPICDYRLQENSVDTYVTGILAGLDMNVIVRFPPAAAVHLGDLPPSPAVFFDRPGHPFNPTRIDDRELTPEDDARLVNELAACDIVVAGPSTFIIDAALFSKPTILVDFYPRDLPPEERIYEYGVEHILNILATSGCRRVESREAFLAAVHEYIAHPAANRSGRERIVREQCWRTDSRAGECVAAYLLEVLGVRR